MRVTSIKIEKLEDKGAIKARASIVLDDAICIHNIRIVEGRKGLFISFPYTKDKNNKILDIVHPINAETREKIQEAIITEYKDLQQG